MITTILYGVCAFIGALYLLFWVLAILAISVLRLAAHARRKQARQPAGAWVDQLIADIGMCPWCRILECAEPDRCTCDEPCGVRYCNALDSEAAP